MKKILLILVLMGIAQPAFSQVGINTTSPNAQLDIKSSNQLTPANTDGILIPKIDAFPLTNPTVAQNSMIVYLTTADDGKVPGFYYWDDATTSWKGIAEKTGWSLTGNAGTDPTVNFIGTTDDNDVVFHRDTIEAGRLGMYDTSFGRGSLRYNTGLRNTAVGNSAMGGFITGFNSGDFNTAVGSSALSHNTTGSSNSSFGSQSLINNNKGSSNTAIGDRALVSNTNASKNVAVGLTALFSQSFANADTPFETDNVAVGVEALYNNNPTTTTNGINNTAVGNYALKANTIGHKNIAVGTNALQQNTQGVDNVGVGYLSLQNNTDGLNNTSMGNYSLEYGNASNNTAVGYYALNHIGGNNNTAVGHLSMSGVSMGPGNTALGAYTLSTVSGTYNTALGFRAGNANTTGNYNISIGANSDVINPAGNNQMSIANVIYGEAMDNILTARFGIGAAPTAKDKFYVYNVQTTLPPNDDGQSTIYGYRTRNSQNDGTAYSRDASNCGVKGYNNWGDKYSFGVSGFSYNDTTDPSYNRSGGVLGAVWNGVYWGSLGYRASSLLNYGVYATAALQTGTGRMVQGSNHEIGIGGGFYGGVIGSWSKGSIGSISSGNVFASYNSGDEYTAGRQVEIVATESGKKALYTMTSTESVVCKKGKIALQNGTAHVAFDADYAQLLGDAPIVTSSPMGQCNGVYIESVSKTGFTIKELNNGMSNVTVSWIAVGGRIDAAQPISGDVLASDFDGNINEVLFNENNKQGNAKAVWSNGSKINFGTPPENLIQNQEKKEEK